MSQEKNDKINNKITFDTNKGLIIIKGVFISETPEESFKQLNIQLDNFFANPTGNLTLDFKIEYFNTNMSMVIRNLLKKLHENSDKTKILIRWFFEKEDEDMEEAGEEFKMLFDNINYELIGVNNF